MGRKAQPVDNHQSCRTADATEHNHEKVIQGEVAGLLPVSEFPSSIIDNVGQQCLRNRAIENSDHEYPSQDSHEGEVGALAWLHEHLSPDE
jgi:hypothetical protein